MQNMKEPMGTNATENGCVKPLRAAGIDNSDRVVGVVGSHAQLDGGIGDLPILGFLDRRSPLILGATQSC